MAAVPLGSNTLTAAVPGANRVLVLLIVINLFNYIDRQVLSAVLPKLSLDAAMFDPGDDWKQTKLGLLTSAFMVAYMLLSPLFGWLDGHGYRRFTLLGIGVLLWSLASGSSGLAASFGVLLLTRCLVGVGEAAYGPIASAMLADIFPLQQRGRVMALFNLAIPVGSALGFLIGGQLADAYGWRSAFQVTYLGLILGLVCLFWTDPPRPKTATTDGPGYFAVLRELRGIPSFVACCTGMTAITFVLGGVAAWVPVYVFEREARFVLTAEVLDKVRTEPVWSDGTPVVPAEVIAKLSPAAGPDVMTVHAFRGKLVAAMTAEEFRRSSGAIIDAAAAPGSITTGTVSLYFGAILVLGGIAATVTGAWLGEKLQGKVKGAYFWVIGGGALLAAPVYLGLLFLPFPLAWAFVFLTVFFLFLHTGPAFTLLANVTRPEIRATAFAINILAIHALGDAISPALIGFVADQSNQQTAFVLMTLMIVIGGVLWIRGAKHLDEDTRRAATG